MPESMGKLESRIDTAWFMFEQTGDARYQHDARELTKQYRARQGIPYSAP